jgi:hypothetical protein
LISLANISSRHVLLLALVARLRIYYDALFCGLFSDDVLTAELVEIDGKLSSVTSTRRERKV